MQMIDLTEGLDREGAIVTIKQGRRMNGANAWMLVCSIMIASLGLDLNSAAVIIGAMLISPLMAPILGIGLGVATNDQEALWIAMRQFGIAIGIALITSTLYFFITPLGLVTDEIRARTEPTLLDGLVAIFGGLAGIISTTRKESSIAIPGVAIATALMPPLCVTGFGIATGNWSVMLNSFYLFFLNSFFIALTSYLIILLLGFPTVAPVDVREARRTRVYVWLFSLLVTIPSAVILRNVYVDMRREQNVRTFIQDNFPKTCIEYKLFAVHPDTSLLVAQLLDQALPDSATLEAYNRMLGEVYHLPNTYLRPIPDYGIQLQQLDRMQYEIDQLETYALQVEELRTRHGRENELLRTQLLQYRPDSAAYALMTQQVKAAFPAVEQFTYGRVRSTAFENAPADLPLVVLRWREGLSAQEQREQAGRLRALLKVMLRVDTVRVIQE